MKIFNSPLKKNLLANFAGIGVQILNQILLVPLFLRLWDVNLYGDWIVITAISSFFAMSDAGLNSVTSNRFTISYAAGKIEECKSLLANNYLLIIVVGCLSLVGAIGYVAIWDIIPSLGLHQLGRREASFVFVILIAQVFLGMATSVIDVLYRANSLNHIAVNLSNGVRLAEFGVVLMCLIGSASMWLLVLLFQIPRCAVFVYKLWNTRSLFKYRVGPRDVDLGLLKTMVYPSLTFMAFPSGNAIVYQGFTLLVNKLFGAEAVVLFNTTRTLCSFLRQMLATMQQAVWPEYSIAYGKNDVSRMRQLHRRAFSIAVSGGLGIGTGLLVSGPWIYQLWTHGKVPFSHTLMAAFLLVMLIEVMWQTSSVCLMATNNHSRLGIGYVLTAALSISLAAVVSHWSRSLAVIQLCQLAIHVPLSVYAVKQGLTMTEDRLLPLLQFWRGASLFKRTGGAA